MGPLERPPLGVYVHLPWCVRKCPYCDFNSHELRGEAPFAAYVDALLEDLGQDLPLVEGRAVQTVFFGGGTPSLCPPEQVGRFLDGLARCLPVATDVEVTLEANPGAVERGRFSELAAAGVNRISLGVQSFQPALLRAIGRIHDDREALAAIGELAAAGIDNFNIDLMYGLPGQSVPDAAADLRRALEAGPAHLSLYQLTLEPGTAFFRRPPQLPDEDACWEMEREAADLLEAAGFRRYEVSAWARPGAACRHNLNYWLFGDYLGLGAGAHGKLTLADGRVLRRRRRRRPAGWLEGERLEGEEWPDADALVFEFMLNALRLVEGFSLELFAQRTGLAAGRVGPRLEAARSQGLVEEPTPGFWRPTALGRRFLNDLQGRFLPPGEG
ncbi:radical SAM family heme chaperone HemW [Thioalkalivibrio sp. XN279]|uniref:radical SAM family heme chaperone HemW n=1 Tax=Thioalkalivibrio sp. XN279 TaxID=2714953 RepID=UPI00140A50D7|nr:radical SAM family heme chaperone HemW [Thioalkalivibrio sp. XN279]